MKVKFISLFIILVLITSLFSYRIGIINGENRLVDRYDRPIRALIRQCSFVLRDLERGNDSDILDKLISEPLLLNSQAGDRTPEIYKVYNKID